MNFFIRFGVHKDREVIKELREIISGIFVPAHILSYSPNPTIAAIDYINKGYYIDPMTYIYAGSNIYDYVVLDKKTKKNNFKPSIAKMTEDYGLTQHFASSSYAALKPSDFTDDFIDKFSEKSIALQLQKIESEKQGAYKRYKDLLAKVGEEQLVKKLNEVHKPQAIIPPYFYFDTIDSEWVDINKKLIASIKAKTKESVIPIILTNANCLTEGLLTEYVGFNDLFIWIDDLNEKDGSVSIQTQVNKLKKLASFIKLAQEKKVRITNLYGSYFSLLLSKLGIAGVCNGIFYGETKPRISKIGGGPPVRYYIREAHEFFPVPAAIRLLKDARYKNLLDTQCTKCMALINNNPDNIIGFEADHSKAQRNFVYAREMELETINQNNLATLLNDLHTTYTTYSPLDTFIVGKKGIAHLEAWKLALEGEVPNQDN